MEYLWTIHTEKGLFCEEVPEKISSAIGPFGLPLLLPKICRKELRKYGCKVFRSGVIDYSAATVEISYHSGIKHFGLVIETVPRIRIWGGIWTAEEFLEESESEFPSGVTIEDFIEIPVDAKVQLQAAIDKRGY